MRRLTTLHDADAGELRVWFRVIDGFPIAAGNDDVRSIIVCGLKLFGTYIGDFREARWFRAADHRLRNQINSWFSHLITKCKLLGCRDPKLRQFTQQVSA